MMRLYLLAFIINRILTLLIITPKQIFKTEFRSNSIFDSRFIGKGSINGWDN
jgi:hypothetical protein